MAKESGNPLQLRDATVTFADGGGGSVKTLTFRVSADGIKYRIAYDADDVEARDHDGTVVVVRDGAKTGMPYLEMSNVRCYDMGNGVTTKALIQNSITGWVDTGGAAFPDHITGTLTLALAGTDGTSIVWTGARLKNTGTAINVQPEGVFADVLRFESIADAVETPA